MTCDGDVSRTDDDGDGERRAGVWKAEVGVGVEEEGCDRTSAGHGLATWTEGWWTRGDSYADEGATSCRHRRHIWK